MKNNSFSKLVNVFQERATPEKGYLVGYGAIVKFYDLNAPLPDVLALLSQKHRRISSATVNCYR